MYIPPFCKRSQLGPEGALYSSPPSRALSSFSPQMPSELEKHGWKPGRACHLYVSGLGHLGDCLSGIDPTTLALLTLASATLLLAIVYYCVKGKLH